MNDDFRITPLLEQYIESAPQAIWSVMGQLSMYDRVIYYWVGKDFYSGRGTIIDGGALVGATTSILAEGLKANPHYKSKDPVIHVYDLFQDTSEGYSAKVIKEWYFEHHNKDGIYDWEHIFQKNLAPYSDILKVHKGDIAAQKYRDNRKIEILSIDVAKTPALMIDVARNFFPSMDEERSIVLHQDYVFAFQPWLHIAMEKLAGHFAKVYDPPTNCTSIFSLIKPLNESDVARILGTSGDDYYNLENVSYLYQAIEKADTHFGKIILTASLSYFYMMMGKTETAKFVAKRMLDQYDVSQAFIERTDLLSLFSIQLGVDYKDYYPELTGGKQKLMKTRFFAKQVRGRIQRLFVK
jgi:hypothetical protein